MAKKHNDYGTGIPKHEMEALARVILPSIQAYYATEKGRREYAEWQASQTMEDKAKKTDNKVK